MRRHLRVASFLCTYDEKVLINLQETDIITWDYALWNGQVEDFD